MSQGDNKRPKTKSLRRAGRKFQASEAAGAVLGDSMALFGMGYEGHNTWACGLLDQFAPERWRSGSYFSVSCGCGALV